MLLLLLLLPRAARRSVSRCRGAFAECPGGGRCRSAAKRPCFPQRARLISRAIKPPLAQTGLFSVASFDFCDAFANRPGGVFLPITVLRSWIARAFYSIIRYKTCRAYLSREKFITAENRTESSITRFVASTVPMRCIINWTATATGALLDDGARREISAETIRI